MVKRINKERCCIYYIGFVHSVFIGFMILCGIYLRTYVLRANKLIIKIDNLIDDISFIPQEASLFINKGEQLYSHIYEVLDNSSDLLDNTHTHVISRFKQMDDTNKFINNIGTEINTTLNKFESALRYIVFLKNHFSQQQIKTFTNDVNNTIIMTREIVGILRNTTYVLERRINDIVLNNAVNGSEFGIIQQT